MKSVYSNKATRYIWWHFRFSGIYPFATWRWLYWCYGVVMQIIFMVMHPLHVFLALTFITEFRRILGTLYIGLSLVSATVKQWMLFPYLTKNLVQARVHFAALDAYAHGNAQEQELLRQMVLSCQRLYALYIIAYSSSLTVFCIVGLLRHQPPFEAWFPFDWHSSELAYGAATLYQILGAFFQIMQNISSDLYPPTYLTVMISQYRLLNLRVARLGSDVNENVEHHNKELLRAIANHKELLALHECIRPIISRTMFAQFIATGLILCIAAVFYITSNRSMLELLNVSLYLSLIITEVLPCCWYINKLVDEANLLTMALYSCKWYDQDHRFRKTLLTFMQRSQKVTPIMAGNLAPVTLQTFLAMVRFSFSMFTLLNKMNS